MTIDAVVSSFVNYHNSINIFTHILSYDLKNFHRSYNREINDR